MVPPPQTNTTSPDRIGADAYNPFPSIYDAPSLTRGSVLPAPLSALRFYASNRIDALRDLPIDGSHRPRLLTVMRERIEAIIRREGAFTVPKSVGYFVATA